MKEPQNNAITWSFEGGRVVALSDSISLIPCWVYCMMFSFLAWLNPCLRQGMQGLATDLADKESCSALGGGVGSESSGRIPGLTFSKIKSHSM